MANDAKDTGATANKTPELANKPETTAVVGTYAGRRQVGNVSMPVYKLDKGTETPKDGATIRITVGGITTEVVVKAVLKNKDIVVCAAGLAT